ncbi:2TM domain-containing protein [Flagellimonas myxillae]|uniref:2TM domain-containing protein n=1 Tax=Flagellimonas myxillae TaxID=2942214 RepID=UPI00201F0FDF|nr:2TM domain-containing protein [Muricauda myxillae]MCL6265510.1 2TM domain-containing protein [Muricauda myxillae]
MEPTQVRLEKAQQRIRKIRRFYTHLAIFLVVNIILYLVKADTMALIIEETGIHEIGFVNYLHWQFWTITLSWVIILLVQGLQLFGRPLIAKWEQRKIKELMDKEDQDFQSN